MEEQYKLKLVHKDDSVGISTESKQTRFTEGFSTGSCTGFGLFLIRKMIDLYGFQIQETSKAGKNAKFTTATPKLSRTKELSDCKKN